MKRYLIRDERETSVDHAADRIAYLLLAFGLLAIVAYRGFVEGEESWDLMGLLVLSGLVGSAYRLNQCAVTLRWLIVTAAAVAAGLVVAAMLVMVLR